MEADALNETKITHWKLKHNETGETTIIENAEYLGNYKSYKGVYSVEDQIKSEPSIALTKISDFQIEDTNGNDLTDEILNNDGPLLLVVNYKLKGGKAVEKKRMVSDSLWLVDSISIDGTSESAFVKSFDKVVQKEETYTDYVWDEDYLKKHSKLKPFTDAAKVQNIPIIMAIGGADEMQIKDFDMDTQLGIRYGTADDILLKTIVRSNPGVVLMKDGKILDKWHIKKLPDFESVAKKHLQ